MDTTAIDAATSALAALRGNRPDVVRIAMGDGETAQIQVPNVKRWKGRLAKLLASYPWKHLTPLNTKGDVVGPRVENPEFGNATELEELEELPTSGVMVHLSGMLQLMLKAQDVALRNQASAYNSVLENNQKLLGTITDRLASMEKQRMHDIKAIADLKMALTAGSASEDGDSEVIGMVAQLVQAHMAQGPQGGQAQ